MSASFGGRPSESRPSEQRISHVTASEEETLRFGRALGASLRAPAWIGLHGPLGAGKTRLVQGVAAGLGYAGRVRSPSYVLEHRYPARWPILHLDLYRLDEPGADLEADWEEFEGVVLVEWAERVPDPPPGAFRLSITPLDEARRAIELCWPEGSAALPHFGLEGAV